MRLFLIFAIIIVIVLGVIFFVVLTDNSRKAQTAQSLILPPHIANLPTTKDSTGAISVAIPTGWTENKSGMLGAKLILMGPLHGDFTTNITLMTEDTGRMTLSNYRIISEKNAPKLIVGFNSISTRGTTLGGIPAYEWIFSGVTGVKQSKMRFKACYTVRNGKAYILTLTAPEAYFASDVAAFDIAAISLRWLN